MYIALYYLICSKPHAADVSLLTVLCSKRSLHLPGSVIFSSVGEGYWTEVFLLQRNHQDKDLSSARPAKPVHLKVRQINFRFCTFSYRVLEYFNLFLTVPTLSCIPHANIQPAKLHYDQTLLGTLLTFDMTRTFCHYIAPRDLALQYYSRFHS